VTGGTVDSGADSKTLTYTAGSGPTVTITLDVEDSNGCKNSCQQLVAVSPEATVDAGPDQSKCYTGSPVTFDLTGTAAWIGTLSYLWTGSSGVTITNETTLNPTVSFIGPGTETITLQLTGGFAVIDQGFNLEVLVCPKSDTVNLTIHPSPTASITPDPATAQVGVGLQLNGNPTGGSGTYITHTWTGIGAAHLSATNIEKPVFSADAPGSYPLTYTVTDSNGCAGFDDIVVLVTNAAPVAAPQILTTCKNAALAVTLTATDPQIDPLDPTLHPLTFAINSAPTHGAISGDLTAVTYASPHAASVTVTYTPDTDFLGTDAFSFIVTDPFGAFGIGIVTIAVEECEEVAGGGGGVFADVVINEVAWAGTNADPEDEWIELHNNSDQTIDLTGWILRWRRKQPATPEDEIWKVVDLSGTIGPNGYYLLERRHEETVSDIDSDLLYDTVPPYPLELVDLGEVMELLNAQGDVVDTANVDRPERDGWIAGTGSDGLPPFGTMERIDPLSPDTDDNWATNRHLIINGLDALTELLTATAVMINENTLIQTLAGGTPQVVELGEQVTIAVDFPLAADGAEGLPQVILARMDPAAGGGGAALEPSAQAAALTGRRVGGTYELLLDTSALTPGIYGLWLSMGDGVFHGLLFEIVEE